jgi:hypothetical protein
MTDSVSLTTLLSRMTRELRRVEERLTNLEHAIGDIVLEAQSLRSPRFHELQELDRARQEVSGIAEFVDNVAVAASQEWMIDTAPLGRSLGLEALAAALRRDEASKGEFEDYEHFVEDRCDATSEALSDT